MTGQGVRTSCRDLFKEMEILPLKSQCMFSILSFVVKSKKLFISNYDSHNVRTRQCEDLPSPSAVLTLYQNGVYFIGINIFNKLPSYHKELVWSPKIIKRTLKEYLVFNCFYKLVEFYGVNS
jgi:hypothetical protein